MNLQIIKSINGLDEYVLLPVAIYEKLHTEIDQELRQEQDYVLFEPSDYINNPLALARIQAGKTQQELALCMGVTQAYISKLERQDKVSVQVQERVQAALKLSNK